MDVERGLIGIGTRVTIEHGGPRISQKINFSSALFQGHGGSDDGVRVVHGKYGGVEDGWHQPRRHH